MNRLFVAHPVPVEINRAMSQTLSSLPETEGLRLIPEVNRHITLFFLGETEPVRLPAIKLAIGEVMKQSEPLFVENGQLSFAGKPTHPSMIWVKFERSVAFTNLYSKLRERLLEFLHADESHDDPIPHITLARMKRSFNRLDLALPHFDLKSIRIEYAELWLSRQRKEGVYYESLCRFDFGH